MAISKASAIVAIDDTEWCELSIKGHTSLILQFDTIAAICCAKCQTSCQQSVLQRREASLPFVAAKSRVVPPAAANPWRTLPPNQRIRRDPWRWSRSAPHLTNDSANAGWQTFRRGR